MNDKELFHLASEFSKSVTMNPYQQMNSGAVERPQLQPVKAPLADLWYRNTVIARNLPRGLAYATIANLVRQGTHQKKYFEVKMHP